MKTINQYQKIVPFIIYILALFLFFKLIQPMITIILSSILLTYISFPVYHSIKKKIPNKSISIILSLLIVVIIILIPFSFLAVGIGQQGYYFYNSLSKTVVKGALLGFACNSEDSKVCLILNQAEKFSVEQLSKFGIDKQLQIYLPIIEEKIKNFLLAIPLIIGQLFITLVITYFILKDYKAIFKKISNILPIRTNKKKKNY
jgi:predicted PurR-regulated permease PerM